MPAPDLISYISVATYTSLPATVIEVTNGLTNAFGLKEKPEWLGLAVSLVICFPVKLTILVSRFIGNGASTVQRSVGALIEKDVLGEEENEGGTRLRFEDPFLSQWIRKFPARASGLLPPQISSNGKESE